MFVATGWHGHGFIGSPALGEAVIDWMLRGEAIDAFDPRRFDGEESFEIADGMTVEDG